MQKMIDEGKKTMEMPALGLNEQGNLCVIPNVAPHWPKLIGICGELQSGKDTIGARLVTSYGYTRYAFADPLKSLARAIGWNGEKDETGRKLLQDLGHGAREILGTDVWVRAMDRAVFGEGVDIRPFRVVVTDVRYENEAHWIHSNGGVVWKVIRPGVDRTGEASQHVTERNVRRIQADVLVPNVGTVEQLYELVDLLMDEGKEAS
jgi:hypothetical protein